MLRVRRLLTVHPRGALLVLALALLMRAVIPQGMMATSTRDTASGGQTISVLLCDGNGPAERRMVPLDGKRHDGGQATPCAFSLLHHAALDKIDGEWTLAARVLPAQTTPRRLAALRLVAVPYLKPPPQGPPSAI